MKFPFLIDCLSGRRFWLEIRPPFTSFCLHLRCGLLRFCMRQNIKLESSLVGSVQSTLKYHSPCALCRAVSILGTLHSVRAYRLLRILLLLVCFGVVRAIFGLLFALSLSTGISCTPRKARCFCCFSLFLRCYLFLGCSLLLCQQLIVSPFEKAKNVSERKWNFCKSSAPG